MSTTDAISTEPMTRYWSCVRMRVKRHPAQARPGEDDLDDEGAGHERAQRVAEQGDHRVQRVPQRVLVDDDPLGQSLRARRSSRSRGAARRAGCRASGACGWPAARGRPRAPGAPGATAGRPSAQCREIVVVDRAHAADRKPPGPRGSISSSRPERISGTDSQTKAMRDSALSTHESAAPRPRCRAAPPAPR